jgi:hypothetical protein
MDFVTGNSNKLQKLHWDGKISCALDMFTPEPTAHATLVIIKVQEKYFLCIE